MATCRHPVTQLAAPAFARLDLERNARRCYGNEVLVTKNPLKMLCHPVTSGAAPLWDTHLLQLSM